MAKQEQLLHTPSLYSYVSNHRVKVTSDIIQTATQLNLIMDKGILKCYTRIQHSDLDNQTHTPIFIPRSSKLVHLFILHLHNTHKHCSVSQTLTYYRQYAWTPKLRTVISSLLRSCATCQILRKPPAKRPPPPPLPRSRVAYVRPFTTVGVDNTGSFRVRGTLEEKRYLTLFVCTTTRYLHVEVSSSLSSEDFLLALRRFVAQYGTPKRILSDNGRNFLGAQRCLAEASKTQEFRRYTNSNGIEWRFQTPRSPWKGGHFERMVGLIKSNLVVSLRHKHLNEEQFRTAVAEAQAVVNSRPLTYLSNDVDDEALTPFHLIRGTLAVTLPYVDSVQAEEEDPGRKLRHQHTLLTQALRSFRERWMKEYLTSLQSRHYSCCVTDVTHQPNVGDLVLLKNSDVARYAWPLARIVEVYPDEKGTVRSVLVKCRGDTYLRSTEYIVPLELCCEQQHTPRERVAERATEVAAVVEEQTDEQLSGSSLPPPIQSADTDSGGEGESSRVLGEMSSPVQSTARRESGVGEVATVQPSAPVIHDVNSADSLSREPRNTSRPLRQAAAHSRRLLSELISEGRV